MADPCPICDRAECQVAVAAERVRAAQDAWDALLKQGGYRAIDAEPPPPEWGALVAASAAYRTAAEDCEAHRADWRARALRAEQERDEAREQAAGNMLAARIEHREAEALRAESRPHAPPPEAKSAKDELTDLHNLISSMRWPTEAQLVVEVILDEIEERAKQASGVTCAPPPEVVEAAERLLELAGRATEGPWTDVRMGRNGVGPRAAEVQLCNPNGVGAIILTHDGSPEGHANVDLIAESTTLAPVVAGWVKEPRR